MDLDLTGRHALVCGASEGIGRAVAHELALMGADVTVLARRADALADVADGLPRHGAQRHGWLAADVAATDALRASVEALAAARPVHILVNNTGGPPGGPASTATAAAYLDAFNRHLIANHTLLQSVLPGMRSAAWGRVVNIVSTSVREPIPNLGVSNTVRGAVASWAKTLSRELAADGITVNNVLPGYTQTRRLEQIIDDRARWRPGRPGGGRGDARQRAGASLRPAAGDRRGGGVPLLARRRLRQRREPAGGWRADAVDLAASPSTRRRPGSDRSTPQMAPGLRRDDQPGPIYSEDATAHRLRLTDAATPLPPASTAHPAARSATLNGCA